MATTVDLPIPGRGVAVHLAQEAGSRARSGTFADAAPQHNTTLFRSHLLSIRPSYRVSSRPSAVPTAELSGFVIQPWATVSDTSSHFGQLAVAGRSVVRSDTLLAFSSLRACIPEASPTQAGKALRGSPSLIVGFMRLTVLALPPKVRAPCAVVNN